MDASFALAPRWMTRGVLDEVVNQVTENRARLRRVEIRDLKSAVHTQGILAFWPREGSVRLTVELGREPTPW